MVWEATGSALIGLALAWGALRLIPGRFPSRILAWVTGPAAALLGGLITRIVTGPGTPLATLSAATLVGAALLSLLVREPNTRRPARPRAA